MSVGEVSLDVLGSGREPDRRRWWLLVVLMVAVIAVVTAAWYVDHRSRTGEVAAVSRCSEQAADAFTESIAETAAMAEYVRPSLVFAPEPSIDGLFDMVAREAAAADDRLQQARDRCAAVQVLGWHRAQRTALGAQLAYVDAELALLTDTAADGRAYFLDRSRISELRDAATAALTAAHPSVP